MRSTSDLPVIDSNGEMASFCSSTGGWLPLICTMNVTVATELVRKLEDLRTGKQAIREERTARKVILITKHVSKLGLGTGKKGGVKPIFGETTGIPKMFVDGGPTSFIPGITDTGSIVSGGVGEIAFSDDQINAIASAVMVGAASGSKTGTAAGQAEATRELERQKILEDRISG